MNKRTIEELSALHCTKGELFKQLKCVEVDKAIDLFAIARADGWS